MISYESSRWYIKIWRLRWYLYAIFLYIKITINIDIITDYLLDYITGEKYSKENSKELKSNWNDIKKHVELSKMYKFSTKYKRED